MQVIIATEAHFRQSANGIVYSDNGTRGYSFWKRYLQVFDSVTVIGRMSPSDGSVVEPVEGPGVSFFPLPGYVGPLQYLSKIKELKKRIRTVCSTDSAVIIRVPGAIGNLVWNEIKRTSRPYGVEVVGDPYDVFAPGAVQHPLRSFFRQWFTTQMKKQCSGACAAMYVTEETLQRRYPCKNYSVGVSDVEIDDDSLVSSPRLYSSSKNSFTLITVGSLEQLYKAPDVLIDAVSICVQDGLDLKLVFVGDGKYRRELENRAKNRGLKDHVHFLGQLPAGDAVRSQLDNSDLFILPSKTEGLPRALIEAMARGLPCIGSTAGGIPELLPAEDMVPPGDVNALANKIREVLTDPARMSRMSARNLQRAACYHQRILNTKRIKFYKHVKQKTEEWMLSKKLL